MSYPKTGQEVYVSLNLSNTMLTGIGKGTITREEVSVDYLKRLFAEHGVIVSAKPEQHRLLEIVNATFDLGLELPEELKLFQLSEQHRRLVVINVQGPVSYTHLAGSGGSGQRHGVLPRPAESDRRAVRRHGGSLLSGQRGAAGAGNPAPAGAGGDTGLPTGHSHGDGLFPAAAVGGAVPPLRLRCTVQPMRGIGRMIGAIWKNRH